MVWLVCSSFSLLLSCSLWAHPMGCSFFRRKICSNVGSPRVTFLLGNIQLLLCGVLHRLQQLSSPLWALPREYLLYHSILHRVQGSFSSTMVLSTDYREIPAPLWFLFMGCRGISALVPGAAPPFPSSLTLVFTGLFLTLIFPPPLSVWHLHMAYIRYGI